jgi:hypothetical protein
LRTYLYRFLFFFIPLKIIKNERRIENSETLFSGKGRVGKNFLISLIEKKTKTIRKNKICLPN